MSRQRAPPPQSGLTNIGNTCFLNATLQCLVAAAPLRDLLLAHHARWRAAYTAAFGKNQVGPCQCDGADGDSDDPPAPAPAHPGFLALALHAHRACGARRAAAFAPRPVIAELARAGTRLASDGRQADAHEALKVLVGDALEVKSCMMRPRKRRRRRGDCYDGRRDGDDADGWPAGPRAALAAAALFRGSLVSSVRCGTCGATSAREEPFTDLSLELRADAGDSDVAVAAAAGDSQASAGVGCTPADAGAPLLLEDLLARFARAETLRGANAYHCRGACGGAVPRAEKRLRVRGAPPKLLALHLKRFRGRRGARGKLQCRVRFPAALDLSPICAAPGGGADAGGAGARLFAVLAHAGDDLRSGHYVAFVRRTRKWYRCDDARVSAVAEAAVFSESVQRGAYLLFYQTSP